MLDEGEGAIHAISWNGPFIAYANDRGVRVYDDEHQIRIFKMPVPSIVFLFLCLLALVSCPPFSFLP